MIIMEMMTSYWDDLIGMFFLILIGSYHSIQRDDYHGKYNASIVGMITLRKLRLYLAKMVSRIQEWGHDMGLIREFISNRWWIWNIQYYKSMDKYFYSYGYGSIPINTIFSGLFTSINPSYFDVNYRGTIGFDTLPYNLFHL